MIVAVLIHSRRSPPLGWWRWCCCCCCCFCCCQRALNTHNSISSLKNYSSLLKDHGSSSSSLAKTGRFKPALWLFLYTLFCLSVCPEPRLSKRRRRTYSSVSLLLVWNQTQLAASVAVCLSVWWRNEKEKEKSSNLPRWELLWLPGKQAIGQSETQHTHTHHVRREPIAILEWER